MSKSRSSPPLVQNLPKQLNCGTHRCKMSTDCKNDALLPKGTLRRRMPRQTKQKTTGTERGCSPRVGNRPSLRKTASHSSRTGASSDAAPQCQIIEVLKIREEVILQLPQLQLLQLLVLSVGPQGSQSSSILDFGLVRSHIAAPGCPSGSSGSGNGKLEIWQRSLLRDDQCRT